MEEYRILAEELFIALEQNLEDTGISTEYDLTICEAVCSVQNYSLRILFDDAGVVLYETTGDYEEEYLKSIDFDEYENGYGFAMKLCYDVFYYINLNN